MEFAINFKSIKVASSVVSSSSALAAHDTSGVTAGTKRKRTGEMKYYAVRAGFNPGVYTSWADCMAQIKGFKGAKCRWIL